VIHAVEFSRTLLIFLFDLPFLYFYLSAALEFIPHFVFLNIPSHFVSFFPFCAKSTKKLKMNPSCCSYKEDIKGIDAEMTEEVDPFGTK